MEVGRTNKEGELCHSRCKQGDIVVDLGDSYSALSVLGVEGATSTLCLEGGMWGGMWGIKQSELAPSILFGFVATSTATNIKHKNKYFRIFFTKFTFKIEIYDNEHNLRIFHLVTVYRCMIRSQIANKMSIWVDIVAIISFEIFINENKNKMKIKYF